MAARGARDNAQHERFFTVGCRHTGINSHTDAGTFVAVDKQYLYSTIPVPVPRQVRDVLKRQMQGRKDHDGLHPPGSTRNNI